MTLIKVGLLLLLIKLYEPSSIEIISSLILFLPGSLQLAGFSILTVLGMFFFGNGYLFLSAFALSVIFERINSRIIFGLSAISILTLILYQYFPDIATINTSKVAFYFYILLTIGCVEMVLENQYTSRLTPAWVQINKALWGVVDSTKKIMEFIKSEKYVQPFNLSSPYARILLSTLVVSNYFFIKDRIAELKIFEKYFTQEITQHYISYTGKYIFFLLFIYMAFSAVVLFSIKVRRKILVYTTLFMCVYLSANFLFSRSTTGLIGSVRILSISPSETSEPWVDVVVNGVNFGSSPTHNVLTINKVEQRVLKWSDNEIIFRTNPSTTPKGILVVQLKGRNESNSAVFKYLFNK